jgi:SAM-dependent methyltransferase
MNNYFTDTRIAQRYATSRRSYHVAVADQIRTLCGLNAHATIGLALDVGCGTGLSTVALASIAGKVIGCDASQSMLEYAAPHDRVEYRLASAEHLPVEDGSVDFVTAGSAYHWFDQPLFLAEASRILRNRGHLAIYADWFVGMPRNSNFIRWYSEVHSVRYPPPPRGKMFPNSDDADKLGLAFVGRSDFGHYQEYTLDELVDYLMTQSNIGAVVHSGGKDISVMAEEIRTDISACFGRDAQQFEFAGSVVCLQKRKE